MTNESGKGASAPEPAPAASESTGCCPFVRSGGLHGEDCNDLGRGPCKARIEELERALADNPLASSVALLAAKYKGELTQERARTRQAEDLAVQLAGMHAELSDRTRAAEAELARLKPSVELESLLTEARNLREAVDERGPDEEHCAELLNKAALDWARAELAKNQGRTDGS